MQPVDLRSHIISQMECSDYIYMIPHSPPRCGLCPCPWYFASFSCFFLLMLPSLGIATSITTAYHYTTNTWNSVSLCKGLSLGQTCFIYGWKVDNKISLVIATSKLQSEYGSRYSTWKSRVSGKVCFCRVAPVLVCIILCVYTTVKVCSISPCNRKVKEDM